MAIGGAKPLLAFRARANAFRAKAVVSIHNHNHNHNATWTWYPEVIHEVHQEGRIEFSKTTGPCWWGSMTPKLGSGPPMNTCGYKILLPTAVCWHAISRAAHVQVIWPGAPWVWISSALPPRLGPATAGIHDEWRLNCPLTGLIFECCWESLTLSCIKGGGPPSPMYSRTQVRPYIILWCYMWSVDWRGQTAS